MTSPWPRSVANWVVHELPRELGDRTLREILVPRRDVVSVEADVPASEALEVLVEEGRSRAPVIEGDLDRILGVVHTKELALARFSGDDTATLEDLIRPVLAVHELVTADRILALLKEQRSVMAIVVDDFGGTAGIITAEDILTELLGEVADEFKHEGGPPRRLPDGRVRLPGDLPVHEAEDWVGVDWQSDSHTVGGLVMERLGRVPEPGDSLEIDGVQLEVERVEHYAVRSILARPVAPRRDAES